jgi:hypothetical protein
MPSLTVHIPLPLLNPGKRRLNGPGLRRELVIALIKSFQTSKTASTGAKLRGSVFRPRNAA